MPEVDIAIIGAGIGGLTLVLALQKSGQKPVIYEQAPSLDEVGAGISLSPNAMNVLDHLGVGGAVEEASTQMTEGTVRHFKTDQLLAPRRLSGEYTEKYNREYYQIHRADLQRILANAVTANDPDCLRLGYQLQHLEQHESHASMSFSNDERIDSTIVVGADGAKSRVRGKAFCDPAPIFSGYVAYRGLVPTELLNPTTLPTGVALSIGPDQIFMRYTVRHGNLLNIVGIITADEWDQEGWNFRADNQECAKHFSDWHPDILQIIDNTPDGSLFKWALIHRQALNSFISGQVILLGDAAHTISPFLGQGAAMAIEDAIVLARCFATQDDLNDVKATYDRMRVDRCRWVLEESQEQAKRMMTVHPEDYNPAILRNIRDELFSYRAATEDVGERATCM